MLKKIDGFTRNILIVFAGTSLANFLNLVFQLLIAHKLYPTDFAAFNSLLSLYTIFIAPLMPIQYAVAKYTSEFRARNQTPKIKYLLSVFLRVNVFGAAATFIILSLVSKPIIDSLKISPFAAGYLVVALISVAWFTPIFSGAVQGMELFKILALASVITGVLKLLLAYIALVMGHSFSGALIALLVANITGIIIYYFPLRHSVSLVVKKAEVHFREVIFYLFPVAISNVCLAVLVSVDMIWVRYFFSPDDSGSYSLAQMLGKIFLFLPGAISIVMFPKTSGLKAQDKDTTATLRKSIFYVLMLCMGAYLFYSIFPEFVLKILTGKATPEAVSLGRLFGISMTFLSLAFTMSYYFLSIHDLRYIKYLVAAVLLQSGLIIVLHKSLMQVQFIMCAISVVLFLFLCALVFKGIMPRKKSQ